MKSLSNPNNAVNRRIRFIAKEMIASNDLSKKKNAKAKSQRMKDKYKMKLRKRTKKNWMIHFWIKSLLLWDLG